jgi:hypothetical protein
MILSPYFDSSFVTVTDVYETPSPNSCYFPKRKEKKREEPLDAGHMYPAPRYSPAKKRRHTGNMYKK